MCVEGIGGPFFSKQKHGETMYESTWEVGIVFLHCRSKIHWIR